MRNILAKSLISLIFILFSASPALALTPADIERANQESQRIQREQSLQQQNDTDEQLRSRHSSSHIDIPAPPKPHGKGEGCRNIQHINIIDAPHMSARKKSAILKKFENHCLGVDEIQSLMGEVTAYYIDKGYATTRAYLPQQDMSGGTLTIQVVEGKVEKIRLKEGDKGSLLIPGVFPWVQGDVLNIRDIEQGLDQINRLSSNNATMDIVPGAKVGESIIVVNNTPGKRWHINTEVDNYGTRGTGREQGGVTASFDDLLGLNEFYSFNKKKSFPFNDRNTQSSSGSALVSVPFGYFTLTGGYSDSNYDSQLVTPSALTVHLNGDSHSWYTTLDRLVYRDRDSKVNVSATLTNKETNNYVAGSRLAISSRTLTVLDLGVTGSTVINGGITNLGFGYSRGLKALGALEDLSGIPGSAPRAQFDKLTASGSYYYPFKFHNENMSISTAVTAQYALDTLFGSEQFSVGGIYSVRGFYEESLANDDGILVRNDLSLTRTIHQPFGPFAPDMLFKPYLALDAGAVGSQNDKTPAGTLVGGAAGFTLAMGAASFDIYAGHPIVAPHGMNNEGFNSFGRLSVNF